MPEYGLTLKQDTGGQRLELQCEHQNGLLYVVPSESSWVCSEELLHVHAMAGFFNQLVELNNADVKELMQRWGLYYRARPLASQESDDDSEAGEG